MNIYKKYLAVMLFSLLAAVYGCGNLSVVVGVLSPSYLEKYKKKDNARLSYVLSLDAKYFADLKRKIEKRFREYYKKQAEYYAKRSLEAQSKNKTSAKTLDLIAQAWEKQIETRGYIQRIDDRINSLADYTSQIRQTFNSYPSDDRMAILSGDRALPANLAYQLGNYISEANAFNQFAKKEFIETNKKAENAAEEKGGTITLEEKQQAIQQAKNEGRLFSLSTASLYGPMGRGIGDDPMAYFVTSAHEDHWGQYYNLADAASCFGNVDIAIIINKFGNYTVKGVVFDPSDVASLVSKAAVQAVIIAAQSAGVPIKPPAGQSGGKGEKNLAAASGGLQDTILLNRRRENKLKKQRKGIKEIALAMIALQDSLEGKDDLEASVTKRREAIEAIYKTYTNYGGLLLVQDVSTD